MSIALTTKLPPLEEGDHLTREEFERRYEAMPHVRKAELIEGVVHMPSPVRLEHHGTPHGHFVTWMGYYETYTPGVILAVESTVRLDDKNEPQPHGFLLFDPECGGQAQISADDYVENGPELVGEIAASTVSIDLHKKKQAYLRNNVKEYIVWRVVDEAIDWYISRQGQFELLPRNSAGIYQSETFPGLWLDADALVHGNMVKVLAVLQQGIASPEHGELVKKLQEMRTKPK
jgi:Putative restriction endonuclease